MRVNNLLRVGQVLVGVLVLLIVLAACTSQQSSGGEESSVGQANSSGGSNVETNQEERKPFSDAFVTGSAGGLYNVIGGGLTKIINDESEYIRLNATTPSSVSQTPQMLHDGQAAFGIGMADMMERAFTGVEEFNTPFANLRAVLALYDNVISMVVLEESPLTNITEVKGLRVGVPSESTKKAVVTILAEAGVAEGEVDWHYLSFNEQGEAIKDGNIDVGVFTAYPKSGLLEELASTRGIRFLEVDESVRASFDQKYPLWSTNMVPGNTYPGVEEDHYFYTIYAILYTHKDVPEHVVYDVAKHILENNAAMAAIHPAGEQITLEKSREFIERNIMDPAFLHPGARQYLEEQGVLP